MNKWSIILLLIAITGADCYAQQTITTYYDPYYKTKKKEVYQVDGYGYKNGSYTSYYEHGAVYAKGSYKSDAKIGKWTYNIDGTTDIETFDNEGNKNGYWLHYCTFNRKIKSFEGTYKINKKDGVWTEYYCGSETKIQKIKSKETYVNGELNGFCTYVDEDDWKTEGTIKGIQKVGEWKTYRSDGSIFKSITYTDAGNGYSEGTEIIYWRNGKINEQRKVTDLFLYTGMGPTLERQGLTGEEMFYDSLGVLYAKNVWDSTKTKGKHYEFFPNGNIEVSCDVLFTNKAWLNDGTKTWGRIYSGHQIIYYPNGNKKSECDKDKNGYLIEGTYYGYLENGEPDEKTKAMLLKQEEEKKKKEEELRLQKEKEREAELQSKLKSQEDSIILLYNQFVNAYTEKKESPILVDEYGKPIVKTTYPKGKNVFEKADTVIKEEIEKRKGITDSNQKLLAGVEILTSLSKLIQMSAGDLSDKDKQLKKVSDPAEIKKILGI